MVRFVSGLPGQRSMAAAASAACALTLLLVLTPVRAAEDTAVVAGVWPSASGQLRLGYRSELDPILINRMHSWVLHLETASGEPVSDAQIIVTGGMPAHDHGLPTQPRVTARPADGEYLLEGLRFHMNGYWEIVVEIRLDRRRDTVTIPIRL
jgi:hypothetical protein